MKKFFLMSMFALLAFGAAAAEPGGSGGSRQG